MKNLVSALLVCFAVLVVTAEGRAQSIAVDINRAKLAWTWTPDATSGTPSEFRMKCGATSGNYTKVTVVADSNAREMAVKDAITGNGNWFCAVSAANQFGESGLSNEVPFVAGAAPSGGLKLTVQAQ